MGNVCLQGAHGRIRVRRGDPNGKGPITTQVVSISTVWEKEKMMDSDFLYNDSAFDDEDFLGNDEEDQMVVDLEVPAASKIGFTRSADPTMSSRRDFHTLSSSFQLPSFEGGWPKSDRKRSKSKSGHHRQGSGSITPNLTDGSEPSVILQMMDVDSALMFDGRVIAPPPRREHASLRYAAQDIALKAADSGEDIDLAVFKPTASAYSNVKKNGKNSPFAPKPRQSSLTVLALDMPKIIAGVLKHFSYAHTQRLSRVNHKWRDAAAKYVLDDIASDSSAKKSSNNRRIMGSSHMSQYQRRAEASDNEDEDDGFAELPTPVTVYRPVTFNMEDNSPGPLPIRITEVTQIRVTPLSTGPARSFRANWGTAPEKPSSSDMDSTPPHRRRYERTDSAFCASDDDDDSTTRGLAASATSTISLADEGLLGQTCVKGRLQSRRDRQVFSDCIFGTDFGLMLTPSGSGIERLYIVGNVGPAPVIRKAPTHSR
ncbi:hypothetical protein BC829DRAFT_491650 [Chytridium lagenaria]|nr:hypothetical protein BC829DRAFT_491650 [Chytridium lagenaria]